ncbi:CRISPR-associated protein Cmr5 [Syntrophus gentianae]|uniref:CRISPR type III-B/RAMP module-associated protein Cmr5 n=1 Tax=Syntrophus gentianae TaxID=43775 RepID=A0A1H7ZK61_9BACT|nr:type III-B CRISPR module-associated protein Cmr5 [Syntrophus gentianae]SEM58705.1 CRISPR-associated protein Cmr5 [Syntrophus gentianae]
MRTMTQKRAEYALERVLSIKDKKDFQSFSAGAPSMVLQNGFGQTLAFWLAKGTKDGKIKENDKHIELFDIVKDWLSLEREDIHNHFTKEKDRTRLMKELAGMDQLQYLAAQNETLALLEWVKRFANADLS